MNTTSTETKSMTLGHYNVKIKYFKGYTVDGLNEPLNEDKSKLSLRVYHNLADAIICEI